MCVALPLLCFRGVSCFVSLCWAQSRNQCHCEEHFATIHQPLFIPFLILLDQNDPFDSFYYFFKTRKIVFTHHTPLTHTFSGSQSRDPPISLVYVTNTTNQPVIEANLGHHNAQTRLHGLQIIPPNAQRVCFLHTVLRRLKIKLIIAILGSGRPASINFN